MTSKDYETVAKAIKAEVDAWNTNTGYKPDVTDASTAAIGLVVISLCTEFADIDETFNTEKFFASCGVEY